jgi:hypothetical protein
MTGQLSFPRLLLDKFITGTKKVLRAIFFLPLMAVAGALLLVLWVRDILHFRRRKVPLFARQVRNTTVENNKSSDRSQNLPQAPRISTEVPPRREYDDEGIRPEGNPQPIEAAAQAIGNRGWRLARPYGFRKGCQAW